MGNSEEASKTGAENPGREEREKGRGGMEANQAHKSEGRGKKVDFLRE